MGHFVCGLVTQFYPRFAWAYDAAVWLLTCGLWYRWVCSADHFVVDEPVLDAGCGTGHLLEHLAGKGIEVIGVDKSSEMVSLARRRLKDAGLPGEVICADARTLPLPDASVGTIINTFPTSYVLEEATWAEYARVLRGGGRWVLMSGLQVDRFHPRLIGLYALTIFEHGLRALRQKQPVLMADVPQFAKQHAGVVKIAGTRVVVRTFTKG